MASIQTVETGQLSRLDNLINSSAPGRQALVRQTTRQLATLEARTLVRLADVQAEGMVQKDKLAEIDHLSREAMTGDALLHEWAETLAGNNAYKYENYLFWARVSRAGKAQIIADTVDTFCREGRF